MSPSQRQRTVAASEKSETRAMKTIIKSRSEFTSAGAQATPAAGRIHAALGTPLPTQSSSFNFAIKLATSSTGCSLNRPESSRGSSAKVGQAESSTGPPFAFCACFAVPQSPQRELDFAKRTQFPLNQRGKLQVGPSRDRRPTCNLQLSTCNHFRDCHFAKRTQFPQPLWASNLPVNFVKNIVSTSYNTTTYIDN
jgi:hypothetical protein